MRELQTEEMEIARFHAQIVRLKVYRVDQEVVSEI